MRKLEIGPAAIPLDGYEHLDIKEGLHIEYVADASKPLPFEDNTFDEIYSSHLIEHIDHRYTIQTLTEWRRILKISGSLDIWTLDFRKIATLYLRNKHSMDGWYPDNPDKISALWASKRIFYWDDDPNGSMWHKACFDKEYLTYCFFEAGFKRARVLEKEENAGFDYGYLNMGIRGIK